MTSFDIPSALERVIVHEYCGSSSTSLLLIVGFVTDQLTNILLGTMDDIASSWMQNCDEFKYPFCSGVNVQLWTIYQL